MDRQPPRKRRSTGSQRSSTARTSQTSTSRSRRPSDQAPSVNGWSFSRMNRADSRKVEWKYDDTFEQGIAGTPADGYSYLLNGLTSGSGATQRIGTSINIRTVEIRASWTNSATVLPGFIRFVLVVDKQANGVTPVLSDILAKPYTTYVNSQRLLATRRRYRILMDKIFEYGALNTSYPLCFHKYLRLRSGIETQYNAGSSALIGDIVTNSLFLFVVTSTTGTQSPAYSMFSRIRYVDM